MTIAKTVIPALLYGLLALPLAGCAAIYTSIVSGDLDVASRMSDTIFLDPVSPEERSVYVEVKNTSDKRQIDVANAIKADISGRGYRVVNDPAQAHYWLQANILYVGAAEITAAEAVLEDGFGGAITTGALTGLGLAAAIDASGEDSEGIATAAGIAVGALSVLTDWMVEDVTFSIITDIRLSERTDTSIQRRDTISLSAGRGDDSESVQRATSQSNRMSYETRVLTTANQVNLTFDEAVAPMSESLATSIGGLF